MKLCLHRGWRQVLAILVVAAVAGGAILAGCNGGGSGPLGGVDGLAGSGNGGAPAPGGSNVVSQFTVSPDRAAPGSVVTLQGIQLDNTTSVTVRFGDKETGLYRRSANQVSVVVPPFLNATGQAIPPASPVQVTIAVGDNGAPVASQNRFTVLPLPAAPNTSELVVQELAILGEFFEEIANEALLPLANGTGGADVQVDRESVIQAIALARSYQYLLVGPNNPNSLQAILDGSAPALGGQRLPKDVVDAMLAQSPLQQELNTLAQALLRVVQEVAPEAVGQGGNNRAIGGRVVPEVPGHFQQLRDTRLANMTPAQRVVATLKIAQTWNEIGKAAEFVGPILDGAAAILAPFVPTHAVAVKVASVSIFVASKIISAIVATLPSEITEFYVRVAGVERKPGSPPVRLFFPGGPGKPATALLEEFVVLRAPGGVLLTPGDIAGQILVWWNIKLPGKFKDVLNNAQGAGAASQLEDYVQGLFGGIVNIANAAWTAIAGTSAPPRWIEGFTLKIPSRKHGPIKLNDARTVGTSVTAATRSAQLLEVQLQTASGNWLLVARAVGQQAGYEARLLDPDLRKLAQNNNVNPDVRGVVNIEQNAQPTPTPSGGNRPTPPPGYQGHCSPNPYPGCCDDTWNTYGVFDPACVS